MNNTIRIGTRGSQLALWQANWVKEQLIRHHPNLDVQIRTIKTTGDKILDVPLAKVGGKGLFVKEIEEALLDKSVDLAVHSMKDVPTELPEGLGIVAVSRREDPRDAVLGSADTPILELPEGAKIGTSSLRRQAQLLAARPDFVIQPLRGNINTRLRKLKEGMYDAIILAMAGVSRLGWENEVTEVIDPDIMLPAIGQGALGIEARLADKTTLDRIAFFNDDATSSCVTAERAFLHRLEGGCQVPIAAHAVREGDKVALTGLVASVDGRRIIRDTDRGPAADAAKLGSSLAGRILEAGGREILEEVYCREMK
ncbi:MAG: hydroxymethylbilane synthase [bacterium]|nr:hydroxymethylbilane synthase [bacterium]MDT8395806.1 hydroxymethylbilane synthase [bacterium]